jgi:glucose-1-phosphate thymidylyltransferase
LAGGTGSRLWPATRAVSKQLIPIFDKPMVYYPLCTLVTAGIREILVITTPQDRAQFGQLLGDGSQWGLRLEYAVQRRPEGIAQALVLGEEFLDGRPVALILGDNLFHGAEFDRQLRAGADPVGGEVFAYRVDDPGAFGVVEFDPLGRVLSIAEKPARPRSSYAVPGFYRYDNEAPKIARAQRPSARGELEITGVNEEYLRRGMLSARVIEQDTAWLDTGTFADLTRAADYVRAIEASRGVKVGCVEESAWRAGFIDDRQLRALAEPLRDSGYGGYLLGLLERESGTTGTAAI